MGARRPLQRERAAVQMERGLAADTCTAPAPSEDTRAPPGWAQEGLAPPVDHIGRPSSACHCDGLRAHSGTRAFDTSSAGGSRPECSLACRRVQPLSFAYGHAHSLACALQTTYGWPAAPYSCS